MNEESKATDPCYYPFGFADFKAPHSLRDIADLISIRMFAGVPFVGEGEGIRDEVPALRLRDNVLGFEAVISGDDGFYTLEIQPDNDAYCAMDDQKHQRTTPLDISEYFLCLLSMIDGVQAMPLDNDGNEDA